jgi:hypothetical protein
MMPVSHSSLFERFDAGVSGRLRRAYDNARLASKANRPFHS